MSLSSHSSLSRSITSKGSFSTFKGTNPPRTFLFSTFFSFCLKSGFAMSVLCFLTCSSSLIILFISSSCFFLSSSMSFYYLKKIFLNTTKSNSLTRLYEKLALTQHIAHLYGPVALIEDQKADILHEDYIEPHKKLLRSASVRYSIKPPVKLPEIFPGVQLRRRTLSDTRQPHSINLGGNNTELKASTEQLRRAFRASAYNKV